MDTNNISGLPLSEKFGSQRSYRLMGVMLFCIACGLLVVRSLTSFISEGLSDLALDTIFSMTLQIGVLVVMPVLFYLFVFKLTPREILEVSSVRRTKPVNYLLAAVLGVTAIFVTMGISTIWQMIISAFGYTHSTPGDTLPDAFNPAIFLLSLFLSAVLPGICEEFATRGGYLTTMRRRFSYGRTLLIMGISFGLFHQYITQVFYTALFGALMAAILIKSKSIIPCVIIHFFNNGMSVYLESAEKYGWFGGKFYDILNDAFVNNLAAVFGVYLLICAFFVALLVLFFHINREKNPPPIRAFKSAPDIFDRLNGTSGADSSALNTAQTDFVPPSAAQNQPTVFAMPVDGMLPAPTLRDNVFYIGAAVVAALTTIFTFIWGLIA